MINIDPYIQRLELLKNYMNMWVELRIDKTRETETFWKLYETSGFMWATMLYKTHIPTFEYYCKKP